MHTPAGRKTADKVTSGAGRGRAAMTDRKENEIDEINIMEYKRNQSVYGQGIFGIYGSAEG